MKKHRCLSQCANKSKGQVETQSNKQKGVMICKPWITKRSPQSQDRIAKALCKHLHEVVAINRLQLGLHPVSRCLHRVILLWVWEKICNPGGSDKYWTHLASVTMTGSSQLNSIGTFLSDGTSSTWITKATGPKHYQDLFSTFHISHQVLSTL